MRTASTQLDGALVTVLRPTLETLQESSKLQSPRTAPYFPTCRARHLRFPGEAAV